MGRTFLIFRLGVYAGGLLWNIAVTLGFLGILAAIATVFARYVAAIVPVSDVGIRLIAVGAILVLSAVNYLGVRLGSTVQTALTIGKVAAIGVLLVVLFGFSASYVSPPQFQSWSPPKPEWAR